jgi:hypothetical protein
MNKPIFWFMIVIILPVFVNVLSNLISEYLVDKTSEIHEISKFDNDRTEPPEMTDKMVMEPNIVGTPQIADKVLEMPRIADKIVETPKIVNQIIDEKAVSIDFWLDAKGKTRFVSRQAVVSYYQVEAAKGRKLFFSLFSRSSSRGAWLPLLKNQAIQAGQLYSFPAAPVSSPFITQGYDLHLQAGTEHFLAVVSAEPNDGSVLVRKELRVDVQ